MATVLRRFLQFFFCGAAFSQKILVGSSGRDTILSVGKHLISYVAPAYWQKDTFVLTVWNAVGVVARARLFPRHGGPHQAEVSISKPGFYALVVTHPRVSGKIWASHRVYVLAPPYVTVAQVRAYHNALLARRLSPSPSEPLEDIAPPLESFPETPPLPDIPIDEEILPEEPPVAPDSPFLNEEVVDEEED